MKTLLTLVIMLSIRYCYGQALKPGDNIKQAFSKKTSYYYYPAPSLTDWAEGEHMLFIADKQNPPDCHQFFIALQDTTLVGVLQGKEPNYFLLDQEGHSILADSSDLFLLPSWVLGHSRRDPDNIDVLSLLDKMYLSILQNNETILSEEIIKQYQQYQTDTALPNRHILLLFDNYQSLVSQVAVDNKKTDSDIAILLMNQLAGECMQLYKRLPVIIHIYMGEALENAGMIEQAREHFRTSLQLYPESIPLKVYNYRYEQDSKKRKLQLQKLRQEHPNHWMAKAL